MVKQCYVYGCSKAAVNINQRWYFNPNDKPATDSVINYEKKKTITFITLGLTQTRLMFILDIPKRHNMMYLNMTKKIMYVDY